MAGSGVHGSQFTVGKNRTGIGVQNSGNREMDQA
jgi:hypothetical protein